MITSLITSLVKEKTRGSWITYETVARYEPRYEPCVFAVWLYTVSISGNGKWETDSIKRMPYPYGSAAAHHGHTRPSPVSAQNFGMCYRGFVQTHNGQCTTARQTHRAYNYDE